MAAKPSDPVLSPPAKRKADASEGVRDTELAAVLSKTEIMILNFHQSGKLSQRRGQALLSMVRHPQFNPAELQSQTIVHLIRRVERPFQEIGMTVYNLWQEGDGDQKLELVVRDYSSDDQRNLSTRMLSPPVGVDEVASDYSLPHAKRGLLRRAHERIVQTARGFHTVQQLNILT